jgi:hypothetical protein
VAPTLHETGLRPAARPPANPRQVPCPDRGPQTLRRSGGKWERVRARLPMYDDCRLPHVKWRQGTQSQPLNLIPACGPRPHILATFLLNLTHSFCASLRSHKPPKWAIHPWTGFAWRAEFRTSRRQQRSSAMLQTLVYRPTAMSLLVQVTTTRASRAPLPHHFWLETISSIPSLQAETWQPDICVTMPKVPAHPRKQLLLIPPWGRLIRSDKGRPT